MRPIPSRRRPSSRRLMRRSRETIQVSIAFVVPDEGGPVAQYRASNDDTTSGGVLSNGVSVPQNVVWTLASGPDGPRTVYGQVKYESGLWSPVASLALTLDRTPSSSLAVDIDSVGSRIPAPASFDWHARTATPDRSDLWPRQR